MALTDFGALDPLKKTKYLTYVMMAGRDATFFLNTGNGFMGRGVADSTKPVHFINELTKTEKGTRCIMPLVLDLENSAIVGDNNLEGNEEEMIADSIEINVDQIRKAVKSKGRMSEQQTVIQFRAKARDALAFWKGDTVDEIMFLVASGVPLTKRYTGANRALGDQIPQLAFASQVSAPSSERVMYSGTATSVATLTAADTMKWDLLMDVKAKLIERRIKPIRVQGKNTWIVVMSPYQARDLKKDSNYRETVRSGDERGKMKNALFTGAFVMVDGLVLYEHNKVYNTLGLASGSKWGSGGTVDGAEALAFGAQAIGYAEIGTPTWDESDTSDYGNKQSVGYSCMMGMVKAKFKSRYDDLTSQDFSTIAIYTAAKP